MNRRPPKGRWCRITKSWYQFMGLLHEHNIVMEQCRSFHRIRSSRPETSASMVIIVIFQRRAPCSVRISLPCSRYLHLGFKSTIAYVLLCSLHKSDRYLSHLRSMIEPRIPSWANGATRQGELPL